MITLACITIKDYILKTRHHLQIYHVPQIDTHWTSLIQSNARFMYTVMRISVDLYALLEWSYVPSKQSFVNQN